MRVESRKRDAPVMQNVWLVFPLALYLFVALRMDVVPVDAGIFRSAADQLFSGRSLHLFADNPEVQIGPLAIVAARVCRFDQSRTSLISVFVAGALLVFVLLGVARLLADAGAKKPRRAQCAVVSLPLALSWTWLIPSTAHIDDALALAFLVWAAVFAGRRWPVAAGTMLGLALDCKPWAVFGMVLLLTGTRFVRSFTFAAIVGGLGWLPFVLGDTRTVTAVGSYANSANSQSFWRLWGVGHAPSDERLIQLAVASLAGFLLIRAGRSVAVLTAIFGARLFFDASSFQYYLPELVLGLVVLDLERADRFPRTLLAAPLLSGFAVAVVGLTSEHFVFTSGFRVGVIGALTVFAIMTSVWDRPLSRLWTGTHAADSNAPRISEVAPFALNTSR